MDWKELHIISTNYLVKDYTTVLKNRVTVQSINQTLEAKLNHVNISLGNVLPIVSCIVTTVTDHQTERTLSLGTCAPAKCNNQPKIQYSGVHPTASSALSPVRTLLFGLRLHHLNTNDIVKFLFTTIGRF